MTVLGLSQGGGQNDGRARLTPAHYAGMGAGLLSGGSVAYATLRFMQERPDDSMKMLAMWGPGFVLGGGALLILYKFVQVFSRSMDRIASGMENIGAQQQTMANAQERQATAQQQTADKDDRQHDQLLTLVTYGNNSIAKVLEKMEARDEQFAAMRADLQELKKSA